MKVKCPERPIDPADWQRHMNVRLRAEFIAGAEEEWRKRNGRPMTAEELGRAPRRYPGDLYDSRGQARRSAHLDRRVRLRPGGFDEIADSDGGAPDRLVDRSASA
jgi:hypothetical protein